MQGYTFTTWDQVETWIKDNGLVKWTFATARIDAESESRKLGDVIANSEWYPGETDHKLAMTRKQLESQAGRYLYGSGYHTTNGTQGCAICDVQLPGVQTQAAVQGVGAPAIYQQQPIDREQLKRELTAQIKYEMGRDQLDADRKQLEAEREEFRKDKEGVLGVAIHYLKPLAQQLLANQSQPMARVAGVPADAPADIPEQEDEVFTNEEQEQLYDLLARFKAVEPDYLTMLSKVVAMAESGDAMYATAKKFLC